MQPAVTMNVILWLFFAQALLGAFDSFYNHEYKERLPHQLSAHLEQRIHAIREFFYSILFIGLAELARVLCMVIAKPSGL